MSLSKLHLVLLVAINKCLALFWLDFSTLILAQLVEFILNLLVFCHEPSF